MQFGLKRKNMQKVKTQAKRVQMLLNENTKMQVVRGLVLSAIMKFKPGQPVSVGNIV
jgi:hypothetical protein